jgi:hypothetical protein
MQVSRAIHSTRPPAATTSIRHCKYVSGLFFDYAYNRNIVSMAIPNPPRVTPPLATLNTLVKALHPDSEEALQYERHRSAQELDTILVDTSPTGDNSFRSRSLQSSSGRSRASTAADTHRTHPEDETWLRPLLRQCNPMVKFWTTHVSIAIEDGAHRDHLGKPLQTKFRLQKTDKISSRAYLPRLSAHLSSPSHDRRNHSTTFPPPTLH